jgi:hypothetical protein
MHREAKADRLSARGVILSMAMVVVMVGMTQAMTIRAQAADVGGSSPPVAPTYLLFLWVAVAGIGTAAGKRLRLSRQDLLLGYCAAMISGPVAHQYAIGFLVPHMVAPYYFDAGWSKFYQWLPPWFGPRDPEVVRAFFLGSDGTVPWRAWALPGVAWMILLGALFLVGHCGMILIRRQWIENERLTFPLAQIPLGLTATDAEGRVQVLREPSFWVALALALALQASHQVHLYAPEIPDLPLRPMVQVETTAMGAPWSGLGTLEFHLVPWLVAIAALLPAEVSFSCWFFFLVTKAEDVSAVFFGATGQPNVYSNEYPALYAQGAGAAYALALLALWGARRHLARMVRAALWARATRASDADLRDEFGTPRFVLFGLFFGLAILLGWLWFAGMRLWVAGLLVALLLGYFFIFARIRGEVGLSMGVILWPKMLDEVILTLVGSRNLLPAELTVLHSLRWLYFGSATGGVVACQLESFKITGDAGLRGSAAGWVLLLAALLTLPVAFAWTLRTYYADGFIVLPIGHSQQSMVGSQVYWSYANLANTLANPSDTEWGGVGAIVAGASLAVGLAALRSRFVWWPLHPIGYMAANSWGMHLNWGSFMLGWLVKGILLRWGGLRLFRRAVPCFLGLVVGDMLSQGFWGAFAAWIAGRP